MRIFLLLAALVPALSHGAEAQDTTFIVNGKQIVVNDSAGQTRVSVFANDSIQLTKTYETAFVDGQEVQRVYVTSPFIPQLVGSKRRHLVDPYPFFYMGFNQIPGSIMGTGGNPAMHSRDSKSWEWGLTPLSSGIGIGSCFAVTSALQIGQVHNHFQDNYVLTTADGVSSMRKIDGEQLKKSYISYTYIRVPFTFDWYKASRGRDIFAAVGMSLEYRWSDHSRYFIGKHKNTETNDINLNPIGVNIEASVGYSVLVLYFRAAVTPLLKKSSAPACYPVGIGLGLSI